jgi:ferredoxin-thioredoxin reductase catalytic subunit
VVPLRYEKDKYLLGRGLEINGHVMRITKFDSIERDFGTKPGYNFKPDDMLWQKRYEKLVELKRKYGHCTVPKSYEQDKSLGNKRVAITRPKQTSI